MPFSVFEDCEEIFDVQDCSRLCIGQGVFKSSRTFGRAQLVVLLYFG